MPYGCNAGPFLGIGVGSGPENCNTDHTVEMFTTDALLARKHQRGLLCGVYFRFLDYISAAGNATMREP